MRRGTCPASTPAPKNISAPIASGKREGRKEGR
nr:MAG TPA: hypothetical protein [Caudoviricetes sp.]